MEGVGESREVGGRRYAVGGSGFLLEEFVNSHCRTDMSMLDARPLLTAWGCVDAVRSPAH